MFDIKAFRKDKNLLQKGLAELLNVSQGHLSMMETGERVITKEHLDLLKKKYGNLDVYIKDIPNIATERVKEELYYAPQLPVSAMAGRLTGFTDSINEWDLENIVVPIKNIDLVIPLSGDSMKPDYPEGCLLLTKKIDEKVFI